MSDSYTHRLEGTQANNIPDRPHSGVIRSPGFPDLDPSKVTRSNSSVTYLIHGLSSKDCVHLNFDDYDLCPQSLIKVGPYTPVL